MPAISKVYRAETNNDLIRIFKTFLRQYLCNLYFPLSNTPIFEIEIPKNQT